jgi:hypothetical protein
MSRTVESTVYKYEELSDRAKDRARQWYREASEGDDLETDYMFNDFERICSMLGVTLRQQPVKLCGGGTRYDPVIYYSGFYSQGDGACFEGSYEYAKGAVAAIKAYAPQDGELHRIAAELATIQRRNFYQLVAHTNHRGRYYHSSSMLADVARDSPTYQDMTEDAEDTVTQCMRDLADWLYTSLEKEYEYQNSDEMVAENIVANEYEFTAEGNPS